ncbi:HAD family hydrolase [Myxococcus sp. CA051A]|uniref:phosphoglycolate phosphatase n=2 Tax=Myxococcus TaxID=32 RepID=A0A540X4K8_9BACT|nr:MULTISPECIES: HAD family hydrolase [Myxococcus]NTX11271.1 HAD family hydrolase [Myxococcus sp. CA056]NTX34629.1 HAD family hydrolase [Myxococcus sp. CA033]NTX49892.1 HAD family hydrolase [Myxococcus sp. CA039A]NTX60543.1 HAD family hydrolase [Myxococcus sp. CA051A]TQF16187.1 HAD family hydrolase [Myxococcus llanfairpwllgwyngyllgogerychwyrndrobwllllantysiliogogogochensis]
MQLRAVFFDLDGTLVDSLGDIADAMNHALAHHGLPTHPESAYRRFVGEGVRELARRAVPAGREDLAAPVLETYRAYYDEHLFDRTASYPGIPALLATLAEEGVVMGVLSNKSDSFVKRLVERLLPGVAFARVYGERPGVPRKPDPTAVLGMAAELELAPGVCGFVGDTAVDMDTARAAGMYGVGVTWGFRDAEELHAHGARAVATTAQELLTALRSASV